MQKKVIAAVVGGLLVAPAAFADVNISGRLSAGLEIYKPDAGNAAAPAASYNNEMRVSDQSSSLIFSGSEDLGGGLSAWFKIDNRFNLGGGAVNSFDSSGNTLFGLKGGFGTFSLGRSDLHYNEMFRYDAAASGSLQSWVTGSVWSQVGNGSALQFIANNTRTPNVIKWDGNFGMVSATIGYSTAPFSNEGSGIGSDGSKGDGTVGTLRWQSGPLSLGASIWSAKTEGTTPLKQDSTRAWVGYDFGGGFSGALGYDTSELTDAGGVKTKRNSIALPLKVKSGPDTFYIRYAMADDMDVGGSTLNNSGAKIFSVGWDHGLSKKTVVGVHYTKLDNDANAQYQLFARGLSGSALSNGEGVSQIYFGMAHFY